MSGRYGAPVSWDMICTQARWFGLRLPAVPQVADPSSPGTSSFGLGARRRTGRLGTRLAGVIPITDDSAKYNCVRSPTVGAVYGMCLFNF